MISFVVPAYNEERLLGATLAAIHAAARAAGRPYEILVADDASTDATGEVARAHGARVIRCQHRQIARVRNTGARASRGDTLIFVDADTIVSTQAVRAALDALSRGAAGGGAAVGMEGVPWWMRLLLPPFNMTMRSAGWAAGCFVFCTRAAFDAAGGFDEHLYVSEEIAFSRALRRVGRVVILRESVLTSGRKARTHSAREFLPLVAGLLRYGTGVFRRPDRLSIWYGGRRHDK